MSSEEPSLPPLKAVAWDEQRQTITNPLKRVRPPRLPSALSTNSSDPAVFSSDDDPDVNNYVEGRHKKRYIGSWFQHDPASSGSRSGSMSSEVQVVPRLKRKFDRNVDSGVFLGSDGAESETFEAMDIPTHPKLPQLSADRDVLPRISEAEKSLRDKIRTCVDTGDQVLDFWGMDLEEISNETIAPLSQFTYIPQVDEDEFEFQQSGSQFELYLAQNRLSRLPGTLFDVSCLSILSLRGNELTEIPPAIKQLTSLQELNLSQNRLQHLPVELLDLFGIDGRLETLTLWPNPFLLPDCSFDEVDENDVEVSEQLSGDAKLAASANSYTPDVLSSSASELVPRLMTRRLGRSAVQVSSASGRITSRFQFPVLETEQSGTRLLNVDKIYLRRQGVPGDRYVYGVKYDAEVSSRTRVPSLTEAIMRRLHGTEHLADLAIYIPDEMAHLSSLVQRSIRQKEAGGLVCSRCQKSIVVPVVEWLEWREVRKVRSDLQLDLLSKAENEHCVPFLHRACSWKCGPVEQHSGWQFPRGIKGFTRGNMLQNWSWGEKPLADGE